ncbi:MAG: hypothetical protein IT457_05730 [Planctomycetes bacterium]|nr:hypothetical protein [Planctomycetota bacterium]
MTFIMQAPLPIQAPSIPQSGGEVVVRLVSSGPDWEFWTGLIGAVGIVVTWVLAARQMKSQSEESGRQLKAQREETTRQLQMQSLDQAAAGVVNMLDTFYRPYIQLSESNKAVYKELRERYADEPDYSTLTYLLRDHQFQENDLALVKLLASNGRRLAALISDNAGCVDDADIQAALSKAAVHFWMLDMAFRKKLVGDGERFAKFTYPKDLDMKLADKQGALQRELVNLREERSRLAALRTSGA